MYNRHISVSFLLSRVFLSLTWFFCTHLLRLRRWFFLKKLNFSSCFFASYVRLRPTSRLRGRVIRPGGLPLPAFVGGRPTMAIGTRKVIFPKLLFLKKKNGGLLLVETAMFTFSYAWIKTFCDVIASTTFLTNHSVRFHFALHQRNVVKALLSPALIYYAHAAKRPVPHYAI